MCCARSQIFKAVALKASKAHQRSVPVSFHFFSLCHPMSAGQSVIFACLIISYHAGTPAEHCFQSAHPISAPTGCLHPQSAVPKRKPPCYRHIAVPSPCSTVPDSSLFAALHLKLQHRSCAFQMPNCHPNSSRELGNCSSANTQMERVAGVTMGQGRGRKI